MIYLRIFIAVLLAVSHSVPAKPAFGQVLASDGGSASFPEPLMFYNLTREEFAAKLLEHRSATKRATGNSIHLHKRDFYLEERANDYEEQMLLEARQEICDTNLGRGTYRIASGHCRSNHANRMVVICRRKGDTTVRRERFEDCPEGYLCDSSKKVINFLGLEVKMPDCRQVLETNERASDNADPVPTYEGHQPIPGPNQLTPDTTEPQWSPSALDNVSTFWEIHDERYIGLTGQWEYFGHYRNGQGFSSRSFGNTRTWSCIGCPAGVLYLVVYGFKTKALGSTFK